MDREKELLKQNLDNQEKPEEIKKFIQDAELLGHEDIAELGKQKLAELQLKVMEVSKTSESQISQVDELGGSNEELRKRTEDVDQEINKETSGLLFKIKKILSLNTERNLKKSDDMEKLTALTEKQEKGEFFTKEDLLFLYEVSRSIDRTGVEEFGFYEKDPRIKELRGKRNLNEDMLVIFECTKSEIAHMPNEINASTKAYVGPLVPGLLQKLPENFEHVYTSFPDKKIRRENVETGGKDAKQLIKELKAAGVNIDSVEEILKSPDFVAGKKREEITLIRLTVADLGFNNSVTVDELYARAQELGLEICSPDTGPNYRLEYKDQPLNEWIHIGMKEIKTRDGHSNIFTLGRDDNELYFFRSDSDYYILDDEFVFQLRKPES
jgi:hypothetical protein